MKYIRGFDGLRGISIIFVLLTHLGLFYILPHSNFYRMRIWTLISGDTGVNIFFSLSGFLITRILWLEKKNKGRVSFKSFYARRFIRLLPPLLIFYAVSLTLMLTGIIKPQYPGLILCFFYLYNFAPSIWYSGHLGPLWSLGVEEQFYLLWPFSLSFLKRKRVILVAVLVILLSAILKFVLPLITINHHGNTYQLAELFDTARFFLPAVGPIMIGSAVSLAVVHKGNGLKDFLEKVSFAPWLCLFIYLCPLYFPLSWFFLTFLFQAFGISCLLGWIYFQQSSLLTRFLEFKPLAYIGKISYGIYVYHGIFIGTGGSGQYWFERAPQNLLLTLVIALISYEFYEKRVLRLKKYFKY